MTVHLSFRVDVDVEAEVVDRTDLDMVAERVLHQITDLLSELQSVKSIEIVTKFKEWS